MDPNDWFGPLEDDFLSRMNRLNEIGQKILDEYPAEPVESELERLLYHFYYAVQYAIFFVKVNGEDQLPDPMTDTEDEIVEKARFIFFRKSNHVLNLLMQAIGEAVYENVHTKLSAQCQDDPDHPLMFLLGKIKAHKELHSRRIKTDPGASRTKSDQIVETYNAVTGERYNVDNRDHKSWRMLIINPLPSDYNLQHIDPAEGGREHMLAIEVLRERGEYTVPEPFSIVVTPEWDKLLRTVHGAIHFTEYINTYLVGSITDDEWDFIEACDEWTENWRLLLTDDWVDQPLGKFSREKKKMPLLVSRMAEMRDFLKEIIEMG